MIHTYLRISPEKYLPPVLEIPRYGIKKWLIYSYGFAEIRVRKNEGGSFRVCDFFAT